MDELPAYVLDKIGQAVKHYTDKNDYNTEPQELYDNIVNSKINDILGNGDDELSKAVDKILRPFVESREADISAQYNMQKYIGELCNIPAFSIMVFDDGRFEIHNLTKQSATYCQGRLMSDSHFSAIRRVDAGYDYRNYNGLRMPESKYTVSGYGDTIDFSESNLYEGARKMDFTYIGKNDWDQHIIRSKENRKYYVADATVGQDKDLSNAYWYSVSRNNPYYGEPMDSMEDDIEVNIVNPEKIQSDYQRFEYGLLSRLVADCRYFLGNGNGHEKHLWAGSVEAQIDKMRELWNQLEEKPEWLSLDDIDEYEEKMLNFVPHPTDKYGIPKTENTTRRSNRKMYNMYESKMGRPIKFKSGQDMLDTICNGIDLYSPETEQYVFLYNDEYSICVHWGIETEDADEFAELCAGGDGYWGEYIPGGHHSGIYDDPSSYDYHKSQPTNLDWCEDNYRYTWYDTRTWNSAFESYKR